jgi:hypothetical protein
MRELVEGTNREGAEVAEDALKKRRDVTGTGCPRSLTAGADGLFLRSLIKRSRPVC